MRNFFRGEFFFCFLGRFGLGSAPGSPKIYYLCGIAKQLAFTCSKSTMETPIECVKPGQVNNKDTERCH